MGASKEGRNTCRQDRRNLHDLRSSTRLAGIDDTVGPFSRTVVSWELEPRPRLGVARYYPSREPLVLCSVRFRDFWTPTKALASEPKHAPTTRLNSPLLEKRSVLEDPLSPPPTQRFPNKAHKIIYYDRLFAADIFCLWSVHPITNLLFNSCVRRKIIDVAL